MILPQKTWASDENDSALTSTQMLGMRKAKENSQWKYHCSAYE